MKMEVCAIYQRFPLLR